MLSGRLMEDVRAFRRQSPDVDIQMREMSQSAPGEALHHGAIDVAYTPLMGLFPQGMETIKIAEWPMMIALAEDNPLAHEKRITLEMLARVARILFAAGEGDEVLVASGPDIALLPDSFNRITIPHLVYRPISDRRLMAELLLLNRRDETQGACAPGFISR